MSPSRWPAVLAVALMAAWFPGAGTTQAAGDVYVSAQTGDDMSGDGSAGTPWRTITKAFSVLADSNATVYLFPGVYSTNTGETFPLQATVSVVRVSGYSSAGDANPTSCVVDGRSVTVNLFRFTNQIAYFAALTCTNVTRAAILLDGATLFMSNCVVRDSRTTSDLYPAAVQLINNSRLTGVDCTFRSLRGRGVIGHESATLNTANNTWLTNCVFEGNYSDGGTCYGWASSPRFYLTRCTFRANITGTGKPHDSYRGIGVYMRNTSTSHNPDVLVDRCRFLYNTNGAILGINYMLAATPVKNSLFVGNQCEVMFSGYTWGALIDNCTFVTNRGVFSEYVPSFNVALRNCIIVTNLTALADKYQYVRIRDCLMYNVNLGTYDTWNSSNVVTGVDPELRPDWKLRAGSPAIDAGNNAWMGDVLDLAGTARKFDGDLDGSTNVDMGCFEFDPAAGGAPRFAAPLPSYRLYAGRSLTVPVRLEPAAAGAVTGAVTYPADLSGASVLAYPTGVETNDWTLTAADSPGAPNGALVMPTIGESGTSQGVQSLDLGVRLYAEKVFLNPRGTRVFARPGETNQVRVELETPALQAPGAITVMSGAPAGGGNNQFAWVGASLITNGGWQTAGYLQVVGGSGNNTVELSVDNGFVFDAGGQPSVAIDVTSISSPLYVANSGSDTTGRGTLASPLRTLTYAVSLLRPGEEVRVFPGTYSASTGETFPLQPGGVGIVGYDTADHVINGNGLAETLLQYKQTSVTGYLANLTFTNAAATFILLDQGRLVLSNCAVRGAALGTAVPAILMRNNSQLTAFDSEFRRLTAKGVIGVEYGTIANTDHRIAVTNCLFAENYSEFGTVYIDSSAGAKTFLTRCSFLTNGVREWRPHDTYAGTAVYKRDSTTSSLTVDRCRFMGNTNGNVFGVNHINPYTIRNSLFVGNRCSTDAANGGGLMGGYNYGHAVINCTFVNNRGVVDGRSPASAGAGRLLNCLVNSNSTAVGYTTYLTISNTLVWQANPGTYRTNSSANIITDQDPFLNASFYPKADSAAMDAGNNAYMPDPLDLAGNPRIHAKKVQVDLGCYEIIPPPRGAVYLVR